MQDRSVPEAGKAASNREQQKYSKYREIARAAGKTFYPLVHEAHGRVGDAAREVLKVCVQKIAAALRRQPVASVSSIIGAQDFPWRFKSLKPERSTNACVTPCWPTMLWIR